jgi:hypothetical protein
MSGLAADEFCGRECEFLLTLPPGSWISGYCVFYRHSSKRSGEKLRIAVDPDSFDHRRLTELEFSGQEIEYRSASFVQFPRLIKNGEVDEILWTTDQEEAYLSPDIQYRQLSDQTMSLVGEKSMSAAFVARAGSDAVRAVLKGTIKSDEILEIQEQVISGAMIPEY